MKSLLLFPIFIAICCLLIGSTSKTSHSASASAVLADNVSSDTNRELAQARNATTKYHDVANAIADGYEPIGCEDVGPTYVNFDLIDCTFDIDHPEALHYVRQGNNLRLVGVEYVIPIPCTATAPAGFAGDADVWLEGEDGLPIWVLNVWLWQANPDGIFVHENPNLPECPEEARALIRRSDGFASGLKTSK